MKRWVLSAFVLGCTALPLGPASADPVVEPVLCPATATVGSTAPDVPGIFEVNDQGDTFVLGELFIDCPPFEG